MDTVFIDSENRKTSKPHVVMASLNDKIDLRKDEKVLFCPILIYTIHEKHENIINNNKCKISAPTWNDEFELPDGSYSISDIQDYFGYVLKKHKEKDW